jgi:hypothetical protein
MFDSITQLADNAGATNGDRALNYIGMRYFHAICELAVEQFGRDFSLSGVEVRPSSLGSGTRDIYDIILCWKNRNNDYSEKFFVRCDVTELFPFLHTKMSRYTDRETCR